MIVRLASLVGVRLLFNYGWGIIHVLNIDEMVPFGCDGFQQAE